MKVSAGKARDKAEAHRLRISAKANERLDAVDDDNKPSNTAAFVEDSNTVVDSPRVNGGGRRQNSPGSNEKENKEAKRMSAQQCAAKEKEKEPAAAAAGENVEKEEEKDHQVAADFTAKSKIAEEQELAVCANCGKTEELEVTLKTCNGCKLVKYCSRDCQLAHRPHHKNACKKRAAELHDEALFKQPPKEDDCPICFLRLPPRAAGKIFRACCGKLICQGCSFEHRQQSNGPPSCPFCRADTPDEKECIKMLEKRMDANHADAFLQLGMMYLGDERLSIKKDVDKAAKLFHRAAELGFAEAYRQLGFMYCNGIGVNKNETNSNHYYEMGAMRGCSVSRFYLGVMDATDGNLDRAIKHWLISASFGDIRAVNVLNNAMTGGDVTRDQYDQALQSYELCMNEVRSVSRDRAAAYSDEHEYFFDPYYHQP